MYVKRYRPYPRCPTKISYHREAKGKHPKRIWGVFLVTRARVERATFSLGRNCSIQLSYQAIFYIIPYSEAEAKLTTLYSGRSGEKAQVLLPHKGSLASF